MGMVGGGRGAFIGAVHRIAANIDGQIELVAGAFSSDPERSRASGADLFLPPGRCYGTFKELIEGEKALPADQRMDFVSIVTPNHMHAGPAVAFLKAGIHVICDKPLTVSLAEAKKMKAAVEKSGRIFALTHNYTGYPLVRRMREMVQGGDLGAIRLVQVEYPQDWLTGPTETSGNKQAEWRVDPKRSGAGGALGDIGTHAFNLADYVVGLDLAELSADLTSFGEGRALDDNVQIMLRYANGARGALWASQLAVGNENAVMLRVYGTKGGLLWRQENPNQLFWSPYEKPTQILTRGGPDSGVAAGRVTRVPPGHPEGYLEGFANIYGEIALAIKAARGGKKAPRGAHFPTVDDGVKGLAFIEAAVKSYKANGKWVKP